MKLYSNGVIGIVATVTSLVASIELTEGFNTDNPYVYWGGQAALWLLLLSMIVYSFMHWDDNAPVSRRRMVESIVVYLCMYAMAYVGSKYSFVLIFVIGIVEVFLTRKRFGKIK